MLEFLIIFAILAAVVFVVGGPVRAAAAARRPKRPAETSQQNGRTAEPSDRAAPRNGQHAGRDPEARERPPGSFSELAELEAARDAKYREIRDAELDHRTGKLSDADYEAIDQTLRAEAVEILRALDRAAENGHSALP